MINLIERHNYEGKLYELDRGDKKDLYKNNANERQDYVVRKILLTPNIANDSQQNKLFYIHCTVNKNSFNLIINSARYENVNGKCIVDKMKLLLKPYHEPYKIGWAKSVKEIRVNLTRCLFLLGSIWMRCVVMW